MTTPDQIKAIEEAINSLTVRSYTNLKGTTDTVQYPLVSLVEVKKLFRHSLASLLTAEIGVLEGMKIDEGESPDPYDHAATYDMGYNTALDQTIARYREIIKSLE